MSGSEGFPDDETPDAWSASSSEAESDIPLRDRRAHRQVTVQAPQSGPSIPTRRTPTHPPRENARSVDYDFTIARRAHRPTPSTSEGAPIGKGVQKGNRGSRNGHQKAMKRLRQKEKKRQNRDMVATREVVYASSDNGSSGISHHHQAPPPPAPSQPAPPTAPLPAPTPATMEKFLEWNMLWAKSAQGAKDLEALGDTITPIKKSMLENYRLSARLASSEIAMLKEKYSLM